MKQGIDKQPTRPPLILLHGWGMHGGLFQPWLASLQADWMVHVIDLPGHGENRHLTLADNAIEAAGQIHELTVHLPDATWLGWSLGGLLALQLSLQWPQRVRQLVMLCASPCFVRRSAWPDGVPAAVLDRFGRDLQQDVHKTLQRFMALEVLGCANEQSLLRELKALASCGPEPSAATLAAGLRLLKDTDLSCRLDELTQPVLWIAGRRDRLVSPQSMQQAAGLHGGDYHLIRGAGHAPFLTHADALTGTMRPLAGQAAPDGDLLDLSQGVS